MAETSRELVTKTLDFRSPPRVPRQLWLLPWAERTYPSELAAIRAKYPDDIVDAPRALKTPLKTTGDEYAPGVYIDVRVLVQQRALEELGAAEWDVNDTGRAEVFDRPRKLSHGLRIDSLERSRNSRSAPLLVPPAISRGWARPATELEPGETSSPTCHPRSGSAGC